ncbi:MAG: hypothetical protein QHH10_03870 [Peptococcaceae bacterium]|nr:hypothetical protein [Peptococcaceae bacterium]MDH7524436.1 hypothetical protein [Peptococcaceae bacterium]
MLNFVQDRQGGSEAIAFAIVLLLLMLVVLNLLPPVKTAFMYANLTHVHRETMLRMEVAGGLTPAIEQKARDELVQMGFDDNRVDIAGTNAVVDYGETIDLVIRYTYSYDTYALSNFLIYAVNTPRVMEAAGSSVSFNFEK